MSDINIYSYNKFSDRVYIFTEGYSALHRFTMGAIVGNEKILVIDSGMALAGGVRPYMESVLGTDKPMMFTGTHGAIDHCGAAMQFDEAYCCHRDEWMFNKLTFNLHKRLQDLDGFSLYNEEMIEFCHKNLLDNRKTVLKDIDEGFIFDLGGVTVRPIAIPGHTAGSLCYYVPEEKVCFTGDAISVDVQVMNCDVFYNKPEHRAGVAKYISVAPDAPDLSYSDCYRIYAKLVRRVIDTVGDDCTLFSGHLNVPLTIDIAKNVVICCEEIADGKTENDMPAESIFTYQRNSVTGRDFRAHYHGNVDVEYNRNTARVFV